MSTIDIDHRHQLDRREAIERCDKLVSSLEKSLGLTCEREDDALHFTGHGVSGRIVLGDGVVRVNAKLGALLSFRRSAIEESVRKKLNEVFASEGPR